MTIARIATAKAKSAVKKVGQARKKLGLGPVQQKLRAKELKKKNTPPKTKVDDTKKVRAEAAKKAATAKKGPQQRVTAQIRERTLGDVKKVPGYKYATGQSKIANSDPVELGTKYSVKELKATEMAIKKLSDPKSTKRMKQMKELYRDPKKKLSLKQAWRQVADPNDSAQPAIKTLRRAMEYRQGLKSATASPSARPMSTGEKLREKYRRGGGKVVSRQGGGKAINEGSTRGPNPGELDGQDRIDQRKYLKKVEKGGKPPKKRKKTIKKYGGGKIVYRSVSGKVLDGNELVAMIYKND